ncbi:Csu type fimbrial protein [Halomonas elongata]|uniref:Csu type fimbrial protein n=1 Tax=Halomonas elongata TaxID=2746 RepID=UPI00403330F2
MKRLSTLCLSGALCLQSTLGLAQNANEAILNVLVTMELTPACEFSSGSTSTAGNIQLGTMDFGAIIAQDGEVTAQLSGSSGYGIRAICAPGVSAKINLQSSRNAVPSNLGTTRAMVDGAGHSIGYNVYSDVAMSNPLQDGDVIASMVGDGTEKTVPLYGKAFMSRNEVAGEYTDILYITIEM